MGPSEVSCETVRRGGNGGGIRLEVEGCWSWELSSNESPCPLLSWNGSLGSAIVESSTKEISGGCCSERSSGSAEVALADRAAEASSESCRSDLREAAEIVVGESRSFAMGEVAGVGTDE